jgi:hypothetical protein
MAKMTGHFVGISTPRRMIGDFLQASRHIPTIVIHRRMNLAALVEARESSLPRPSWCAIFTKAFASVTAEHAELRRVYVSLPWPRFYEWDANHFSIVIERDYLGESALFLARIRSPETRQLGEIDALIQDFKCRPVEEIAGFRSAIRLAKMPRLVRILAWSLLMNWLPRARGKQIGTHGISVTAGMGATALNLITPWPFALNYDVFSPDGSLDVRMTFDHRVADAAFLARALQEMEQKLLGPIRNEVLSTHRRSAA